MSNMELLDNYKSIPYNYEEDIDELNKVLAQAREINEIQSELSYLIDVQDSDIKHIENTAQESYDISQKANIHLESASGKKFKFSPIIIGSAIGGALTLPFSLTAVSAGSISSALVGYIAGGGVLFGGIIGKKLA